MKKYIFSIVVAIGLIGCGSNLGVSSSSSSSSSSSNQSHSQATSSKSGVENARTIGKNVRDKVNSKVSQKQGKAIFDSQNKQSKMPNDGPHIPPIPGI